MGIRENTAYFTNPPQGSQDISTQFKPHNKQSSFIFNEQNLEQYTDSLQQGIALIQKTLLQNQRPFSGIMPHELARDFENIDLNLTKGSIADALQEVEQLYLKDAVYFHNPRYAAHLNCPVAYPAILAELILTSINSSVDTWDQSAGGTLIEQTLIDWTCELIGLGKQADGIFTSGGTQSNLMAMLLARDHGIEKINPEHSTKQSGLPIEATRFRIFSSEISHFSVQKSAALLGLGYQAVVSVECDERYQMNPMSLKRHIQDAINEGLIPIAVVATAGTTDFGSIDPLPAIADICTQHDLWMHVDAAYGCGLLVSPTRRDRLQGIELADSVTVDYHKSFLQPVSCSAFLVRDKTHLSCVTHHAEYLNPLSAQQEGTPNLVNKSLQTTRRFDALKLWLTLRIAGRETIGNIFDQVCQLASDSYQHFKNNNELQFIHEPELSTLVFRFIPTNTHGQQHTLTQTLIDDTNTYIRKAIFRSGEAVIAGTKVDGQTFLKFTLLNPHTQLSDIDAIITLIKNTGHNYLQSLKQPSESVLSEQSFPQREAIEEALS